METITINDKTLKVKHLKTLRAMFMFEQVSGKAFSLNTLADMYLFYYIVLLTNNPEVDLTWDEYLDYAENDAQFLTQLTEASKKEDKFDGVLVGEIKEGNGKKKSKSAK